jgi:3-oxoacyl-[acyl-carrier-protein] synthase II
VTALIAGSAVRTCLGDGPATFAALLRGGSGRSRLRHGDPAALNVAYGYHLTQDTPGRPFAAGDWLAACVRDALRQARVNPGRQRVVALVGTGLRELSAVEGWSADPYPFPVERLHFADAVHAAAPGVADVVTIANACSASGHALALAQDLIELGDADAVVVGGADAMTESMLAMIGRVADSPTEQVRPFDADRAGVLLGEAAVAMVVVPDTGDVAGQARVLATGLSCDAHHETAPSVAGIARAMRDGLTRAGREPLEVDLVVAHGTGTALNDPAECAALREVLVAGGADPLVTALKGAIGHTSGSAALINVDVAVRCLRTGQVPPVVGLRRPLAEGVGLRFATGGPVSLTPRVVQANAFGFGGVNAVTLVERA